MLFRSGKDHRVFHRTGVELRRANEVADVLEHDEIQLVRPDLAQPLLGHARVEVAHAARVQLDGLHARLADRPRVDVRVNVRLHHAHAQLAPQVNSSGRGSKRLLYRVQLHVEITQYARMARRTLCYQRSVYIMDSEGEE